MQKNVDATARDGASLGPKSGRRRGELEHHDLLNCFSLKDVASFLMCQRSVELAVTLSNIGWLFDQQLRRLSRLMSLSVLPVCLEYL